MFPTNIKTKVVNKKVRHQRFCIYLVRTTDGRKKSYVGKCRKIRESCRVMSEKDEVAWGIRSYPTLAKPDEILHLWTEFPAVSKICPYLSKKSCIDLIWIHQDETLLWVITMSNNYQNINNGQIEKDHLGYDINKRKITESHIHTKKFPDSTQLCLYANASDPSERGWIKWTKSVELFNVSPLICHTWTLSQLPIYIFNQSVLQGPEKLSFSLQR